MAYRLLSHDIVGILADPDTPRIFTESYAPEGHMILCGHSQRAVTYGDDQTQSIEQLPGFPITQSLRDAVSRRAGGGASPYPVADWRVVAVAFHIEETYTVRQHVERLRLREDNGEIEHARLLLSIPGDRGPADILHLSTKRHRDIRDVQRCMKNAADWARNAGTQGAITHELDKLITADPDRLHAQLVAANATPGFRASPRLNNPLAALAF